LLHGRALSEAQAWAEGKHLSQDDYRFLSESAREDQRVQEQAQAAGRTQTAETRLAAERDRLTQEQHLTQRQRIWLGITGTTLGLVSLLGLVAGWQAWQATHSKSRVQLDAIRARIAAAEGSLAADAQLNAVVEAIAARATLDQLKPPLALPWGQNAQPGQRELRAQVDLILRRTIFMAHERHRLVAHPGGVTDLAWSPNGDLLATVGQDGKVKLWSADGRLLATTAARAASLASVAWSRDGLSLWATGLDGQTWAFERPANWDAFPQSSQEQPIVLAGRLVAKGGPGFSMAVNPAPTLDGVAIAIGRISDTSVYPLLPASLNVVPPSNSNPNPHSTASTNPGPAQPRDASSGSAAPQAVSLIDPIWEVSQRSAQNADQNTPVWHVAFSPDGRELWTVRGDRYGRYETATGRALPNPITPDDGSSQYGLDFSPDGMIIATSDQNSATLWRSDGQRLYDLPHGDRVWDVVFSPDGRLLATASDDGRARLWTVTGQLVATFPADRSALRSIAFSPDGRLLTTASQDGTVKFWQWQHPLHQMLTAHQSSIDRVVWWTDGSGFVTGSRDRTVKIWNLDGQVTRTASLPGSVLDAIAIHPHARVLALATDRGLSVLDLMSRASRTAPLLTEFARNQRFRDLAFDRSGQLLTVAEGKVERWNATNGQQLDTLLSQDTTVHGLAIARDGAIATGGEDGTLRLHDHTGQGLWTQNLGSSVVDLTWVGDEQAIAAITRDGQLQLWQRDGKLVRRFERDRTPLTRIDASMDGQAIAVGRTDGTLELWNMHTKQPTLLPLHRGQVDDVQFSPDGRWLLSTGEDATAVLWDLGEMTNLDPLAYACTWVADYLNASETQPYEASGIAAAACDRLPARTP
jgi:WD40 repeat protein